MYTIVIHNIILSVLPQKDLIGVKGRVQTRIIESPDGVKRKKTEIVAEKVTFLTSNPNRKKDTIEDSSLEEE